MTPAEFKTLYPHVIKWIRETLGAHAQDVTTVASRNFSRLPRYFSAEFLSFAKIAVVDRVPVPPLSALGLTRFSDFERGDYDGITYLDTYFVKRSRAHDESLHFHELIHVVQWKFLGPEVFLAAYADGLEKYGYADSPLEKMAYGAQAIFSGSAEAFDAEKLVFEQLK